MTDTKTKALLSSINLLARVYTEDIIEEPSDTDYLLIENAMLLGSLAVQQLDSLTQ